MLPAEGLSSPANISIKVDFPAPLGPMTACISPKATSSARLCTARRPPNLLVRPFTCNNAVGSAIGRNAHSLAGAQPASHSVRKRHHCNDDKDAYRQQPMG